MCLNLGQKTKQGKQRRETRCVEMLTGHASIFNFSLWLSCCSHSSKGTKHPASGQRVGDLPWCLGELACIHMDEVWVSEEHLQPSSTQGLYGRLPGSRWPPRLCSFLPGARTRAGNAQASRLPRLWLPPGTPRLTLCHAALSLSHCHWSGQGPRRLAPLAHS